MPEAFDETRWTLLTEFGRFVHAKCGLRLSTYLLWTPHYGRLGMGYLLTKCMRYRCGLMLSTVEYVKSAGGRRLATVHCGADLFLRTCYQVRR